MKVAGIAVILGLILALASCPASYGAESKLGEMKTNVQKELLQIKALMPKKDPVLVSSMYDSCLIAMNQLDAYFSMSTIFGTIDEKAVKPEAIDVITVWLESIKKINMSNINNTLRDTSAAKSQDTRVRMEKLKALFEELNKEIDNELAKWELIKKSIPLR